MKEYQVPLSVVLGMPKSHFFWMNNMISRVRAEHHLELLRVLVAAQSTPEGLESFEKDYRQELGTVYYHSQPVGAKPLRVEDENELDPDFDRAGLRALKMKHGA